MNYAIIDENNIVINIVAANNSLYENWILIENLPVDIGDYYDGINFYRNNQKVITKEQELRIALNILLRGEENDNH